MKTPLAPAEVLISAEAKGALSVARSRYCCDADAVELDGVAAASSGCEYFGVLT